MASAGYEERSQVIFLGTGTSGGVPDLGCLMDSERKCKTCWDAMNAGSRNRRHNTSIIIKTDYIPVRKRGEKSRKKERKREN